MNATAMVGRLEETSPRLKGRITGAFYLLTILTGIFACFQQIHWRFRSTKAAPAVRMRSAIRAPAGSLEHLLPIVTTRLYQNRLAITALLAHA